MDYNEMLFAYYVRKEAMEQVREMVTADTTQEQFGSMYSTVVENIVNSTRAAAYRIQEVLEK